MRYLVTGGCGFIGSRLVERLLAEGHEVIVLDDLSTGSANVLPPSARLIEGGVEDREAITSGTRAIDGIFHLAAVASVEAAEREPERARRVNVEGTRAMFRAAAAGGDKALPVVLASSAAVYGLAGPNPIREDQATQPAGVYGVTKLAAEDIAGEAFAEQRVPSVAVRLFNMHGPALPGVRPPAGVIGEFCRRMAAGEGLTIHGDGRQQRDFFHIDDAVALLLRAMASISRRPAHLVVNGCTGRGTSLLELASLLSSLSPRPLVWHHGPARAADIPFSVGDPSRAGHHLRYHATTRLPEALPHMLRCCSGPARDLAQAED
jgi:UDP-glucose 4-epimerase